MRKTLYIVCLLALTACSSTTAIPIDDAYYSPALEAPSTPAASSAPSVSSEPSAPSTPTPTMEIISQQDTTITVRIKK